MPVTQTPRVLGCLLALALVYSGCKKPEVEVEEEGPPLPLPLKESAQNTPSASGVSAPQPKTVDQLGLPLKEACRLFEAHLKYGGVTLSESQCHNLRKQGESIRLDSFMLMNPKNQTIRASYNGCFWRKEQGVGWEVGYVDQVARPCESRQQYCKVGATGSIPELSFKACPGDTDHWVLSPKTVLDQLTGTWINHAENSTVTVSKSGEINIKGRATPVKGTLRIVDAVQLEVSTAKHVVPMGYAIIGQSLHLSRGVIAPAKDPNAFALVLSPKRTIRRFRGACYEILAPPRNHPTTVECTKGKGGDLDAIIIKLSERSISLYRVGDYWLDSESLRYRYTKKAQK